MSPSRSLYNPADLPRAPLRSDAPSPQHASENARAARSEVGATADVMQDALKKTREREEKLQLFREQANELKEAAEQMRAQSAIQRQQQSTCRLL